MTGSDSVFAGSIPALYERFMVPMLFQPYAEDLARRVADAGPATVLETAAGTGVVTRAMLRELPETARLRGGSGPMWFLPGREAGGCAAIASGSGQGLNRSMQDRLYRDARLVEFYDIENGWTDDKEFCAGLAGGAGSILDLGCGTGMYAACMAGRGHRVTGVDPARAMLEVARHRPGGEAVRWVEDAAQTLRLGEVFDLIVLTGHAFQVFLTEADRRAVLETIRVHLAPDGLFVFDTRNPAVEEWLDWVPERSERLVAHGGLGKVRAWNDAIHDPATGIVTYDTFYAPMSGGRTLSARSRIAFPGKSELQRLMADAGLFAQSWHGDWAGGLAGVAQPEIIVVGDRRR